MISFRKMGKILLSVEELESLCSAEMGGVFGILLLLDLLTIRRWMMWRVCCVGLRGGG